MYDETDLMTCCVCYNEYDDQDHTPKYLQCFHTACLQCLQVILNENIIKCPICRQSTPCPEEVSHLSNNVHALYMLQVNNDLKELKLQKKSAKREFEEKAIIKASNLCHRSVEELIDKRRQIQSYFQKTLENLEAVKSELVQQSADNESKISQLTQKLEDHKMTKPKATDLNAVDATCRLLLEESAQDFKSISTMTNTFNWEKTVQIKMKMRTVKGQPLTSNPLNEFSVLAAANDHKKSLLSHLIFSILMQHGRALAINTDSDFSSDDDQSDVGVLVSLYDFSDLFRRHYLPPIYESLSESFGLSSPDSFDSDRFNYDMFDDLSTDNDTSGEDLIDSDFQFHEDSDDDYFYDYVHEL